MMLGKKKYLFLIPVFILIFTSSLFAYEHSYSVSNCYNLSPQISFFKSFFLEMFQKMKTRDMSFPDNSLRPRSDMELILNAKTETAYTLEIRQRMDTLALNSDLPALETIILQQDARIGQEKDWKVLTEAVAARNKLGKSRNDYIRTKYQEDLFWCEKYQGRKDMHIHTQFADGLQDFEGIIKEAVRKVIKTIAVTDHNTFEAVEKFREKAAEYGIDVVRGVEISAFKKLTHVKGDIGAEFHILAYGVDFQDPRLNVLLKKISSLFYLKYMSILYNLLTLDTDYAKQDIPQAMKDVFMSAYDERMALYEKYGMADFTDRAEKALNSIREEDWEKYLGILRDLNKKEGFVFTDADAEFIKKFAIFNNEQPQAIERFRKKIEEKLKKRNVVYKASKYGLWNLENSSLPDLPGAKEIIDTIHAAGGMAVFAHPRWYTDIVFQSADWQGDYKQAITDYIEEIAGFGIDGIEAYTHWVDKQEDEYYVSLAEKLGLMISHGTDAHFRGIADMGLGLDGSFYMPTVRLDFLRQKMRFYTEQKIVAQSV